MNGERIEGNNVFVGYDNSQLSLKEKYVFNTWESFWVFIQDDFDEYVTWFKDGIPIGTTKQVLKKYKSGIL